MCLKKNQKTKQSKTKTAESKRSKVNKHGNIQQKSKTKNKSAAASMLSQLLLKQALLYCLLTELKNKTKTKKGQNEMVKWKVKKEKKLQI